MRILTASDIIIADSKSSILPNICEGEKFRASTYNWPETQKLPKKWQQFFNDILHTVIQSQLQNTPLGKWISKGHQQWNYYCDENNDIIARTQFDDNMDNLIPVDIIDKRGIKVIGRQHIFPTEKVKLRYISPVDALKKTQNLVEKIIELLYSDSLCVFMRGAIRDQWGSFSMSFVSKHDRKEIGKREGPDHGNKDFMKEIRIEATSVLTLLTFLKQIEPFLTIIPKVTIHTRSRGLINKIYEKYINRPSLVTSDHIDLFYQNRSVRKSMKIKLSFIYTATAPKAIDETISDKLKYKRTIGVELHSILSSVPPDPNQIDIDDLTSLSSADTLENDNLLFK